MCICTMMYFPPQNQLLLVKNSVRNYFDPNQFDYIYLRKNHNSISIVPSLKFLDNVITNYM